MPMATKQFSDDMIRRLLDSIEELSGKSSHTNEDLKRIRYSKALLGMAVNERDRDSCTDDIRKVIGMPVETDRKVVRSRVARIRDGLAYDDMRCYSRTLKSKAEELSRRLDVDKGVVDVLETGMARNTRDRVWDEEIRERSMGGWLLASVLMSMLVYVVIRMF